MHGERKTNIMPVQQRATPAMMPIVSMMMPLIMPLMVNMMPIMICFDASYDNSLDPVVLCNGP